MNISCSRSQFPKLQAHMTEWSDCTRCTLSQTRTNSVFFRGSVPAKLLFLADFPSDEATSTGLPFAGPSASVLEQYVPEGLSWAVTYLILCGPADDPQSPEITACWPRVLEFIQLTSPDVICTLGKKADSQYLRHMQDVISKLNRRPHIIRVNSPLYSVGAKDKEYEIKKAKLAIQASFEKLLY